MNLLKKCRYGLMIYNNSDQWVGRSLEKYGEFSESEVQVFRDAIKPGSVVLDIGANIGCHTVAFSRIVGPAGTVFAYEPERTNFNTLCGNIAINSIQNVYCFQKAVGATSGSIVVPELDHSRMNNYGGITLDADYSSAATYPVPLITLDESNFVRLNFIKMDIEGMEKLALQGGAQTIANLKPILYVEDDRDDKREALYEYVRSLDYVIYEHWAPLYNPTNFFEDKDDVFYNINGETRVRIMSRNIFCHHKDVECPINPEKFAMKKIGD